MSHFKGVAYPFYKLQWIRSKGAVDEIVLVEKKDMFVLPMDKYDINVKKSNNLN